MCYTSNLQLPCIVHIISHAKDINGLDTQNYNVLYITYIIASFHLICLQYDTLPRASEGTRTGWGAEEILRVYSHNGSDWKMELMCRVTQKLNFSSAFWPILE